MSIVVKEYLVVLLYFVLLLGEAVGEVLWLQRKGWLQGARAALFVSLTDTVGFIIGSTVLFISVFATFALTLDGSVAKLPLQGGGLILILSFGILFLPAFLMLLKRGAWSLMRVPREAGMWRFSLVSSLIFWLLPTALTILLTKLFWQFL